MSRRQLSERETYWRERALLAEDEAKKLADVVRLQLAQLADADAALLAIDADTRALGTAVREFAGRSHPSRRGEVPTENAPPARLRLVTEATSPTNAEGEA